MGSKVRERGRRKRGRNGKPASQGAGERSISLEDAIRRMNPQAGIDHGPNRILVLAAVLMHDRPVSQGEVRAWLAANGVPRSRQRILEWLDRLILSGYVERTGDRGGARYQPTPKARRA